MNDCPFCDRIAAGDYDDRNFGCVTFEPLNPVTPGHRLVVPVRHVEHALDDPRVTGLAAEYAALIALSYGAVQCNLITSVGVSATQTVRHLHWHIVPRREDDGLSLPWTGQGAWPERCGYCYCPLADAPECADGCAHRDLSGHVGCGLKIPPAPVRVVRRSERKPVRGRITKGSAPAEALMIKLTPHIQPKTGRECPYMAVTFCNKCGWFDRAEVPGGET